MKKIKNYQSDISQFLHELKEKNPDLHNQQINGRLRLWDRVDEEKQTHEFKQRKKMKQPSYVYSTYGKKVS